MSKDFPHLDDTRFPDLQTANVYKYRNELDYSAYEVSTKIKLLNVSWCGDYDNAVYFETREERDKWFDSQKGAVKEMPTMFRLYADGDIKVELPIDECMEYNYVMIDYGKAPYQTENAKYGKMFYFISDMKQDSVNTTRLQLAVDYWTTYIYDMGITYVNLERGHAPMAATDAEEYLSNPIGKSELLLTEDVSFGSIQKVSGAKDIVFNGDGNVTLGFLTNASMQMSWVDDNGNPITPTSAWESSQAFSCVDIFVIDDISLWRTFRDSVTEQCPQFYPTVKGMFIIPKKLVTYANEWFFCGVKCHHLYTYHDELAGDVSITKEMFGYPGEYSDIAKLYTYPYSCIEINDFKGGTTLLKVEDTSGNLEVRTMMCDMYPFLSVDAYVNGIGGGTRSVRFVNNYDSRMMIGGRWYDFSTKWSIPVFSVQLEADADWILNKKPDMDTQFAISKNNASNITANAALQVACATNTTTASNTKIDEDVSSNNSIANAIVSNNTAATMSNVNAEIAATDAQASASVDNINTNAGAGAVVGLINSTIEGAASGGGAGAAVGLATGVVSAIGASVTAGSESKLVMSTAGITNNLSYTVASNNTSATKANNTNTMQLNESLARHQKAFNSEATEQANSLTTSSAKNTADCAVNNATLSYNNEQYKIKLGTHPQFGQLTGTQDIVSKPFGLSFNVCTQSANAIRQAAEQFMRYGYTLNMQWKVVSFNVMPRFSYWKCSSVYCDDSGVYEGAQAMVKSILEQGVTVWRDPDDIGKVSIYGNK